MNLTEQEQSLMNVLGDQLPHTPEEVLGAMLDEMADNNTLNQALGRLRKKLRPEGLDIASLNGNNANKQFILVRITASANDGRR